MHGRESNTILNLEVLVINKSVGKDIKEQVK